MTENGFAGPAADTRAIRFMLGQYEAALNASDTEAVMPLYADDSWKIARYSVSPTSPPRA